MELNKEIIAFKRRRVIVSSVEKIDPRDLGEKRNLVLISLVQELEAFGYYLSSESLCRLTIEDMEGIHNNLLPYLSEYLGSGTKFKPLYPGFPQQVIEKSVADLWIDRDRVYSGDLEGFLKDNPWHIKEDSGLIDNNPDKELKPMSLEEFMNIPQQIMSSGNSLTQETRDELEWFLKNYEDIYIPERIPFKETLCLVASLRPEKVEFKEINDVLRYGIYLLGGSPNLRNVPKEINKNSWSREKEANSEWRNFVSLPRKRRRELCQRIEKVVETKGLENCIKDAKTNYGHWLVLSERLHPGEYIVRYPEVTQFFHCLKSHDISKQYRTFNSVLQEKYDNNEDIVDIAKFISTHPGEFVRRFDALLRRSLNESKDGEILDIFFDTEGMKNKTLIELLSYYDRRNLDVPRFVSIPGKGLTKLNELEKLPDYTIEVVQEFIARKIFKNIESRVQEKDLLGKIVYLDPKIKNIQFPKAMRDRNISIPVGTRYPIPEDGIIRFFVHWIQEQGKIEDLDLHAFIWYSNTKSYNIGWNTAIKDSEHSNMAVHSGDVRYRPGDCAEYVDIDLKKARESGAKYIIADICNYEGRGLDTLPCWIGYLKLDTPTIQKTSKTWIPEKVELKAELNCKSVNTAAFLVDIESSEIMILDFPFDGIPVVTPGNTKQTDIISFFTVNKKYSTYDILECYYKARGAEIIDTLPLKECEEEMNDNDNLIEEKVEFQDIASDYVKVLSIIGE